MFNTFAQDKNQHHFTKANTIYSKEKTMELNNFSTIQLNPWNDDNAKINLYFQTENFPSFPKPCLKITSGMKFVPSNQSIKRQNKHQSLDKKRFEPNYLSRKQNFLSRRQKRPQAERNDLQRMNKTISVHNIEGEKMFNQFDSIQRREKTSQKQQKRHRTTINNPMYGKFCNSYIVQKLNIMKRKKVYSSLTSNALESVHTRDVKAIKSKMSTLSINRSDSQRVKSIHEIRKRLKSTSQIMRKQQEKIQIKYSDQSSQIFRQTFQKSFADKQNLKISECKQPTNTKHFASFDESKNVQMLDKGQKFKLGCRKNLYIGFRKFFHPPFHHVNMREKGQSTKQGFSNNVINLQALVDPNQKDLKRKFQTLQEYPIIKQSYQIIS